MPDITAQSLSDIASFQVLEPDYAEFTLTELGFLSLKYKDEIYEKTELIRLLPLTDEDEYISCFQGEKEIGIIRKISDFSKENQDVIQQALDFRYYCMEILKIKSVKEKISLLLIDCVINNKARIVCVNNLYFNIRQYKNDHLMITDAEDDRYIIKNYRASLSKGILSKLEVYLI